MIRPRNVHASKTCANSIACCLLLSVGWVQADELRIGNASVVARDDQTATIQFDVSWLHAWRHSSFHDAAWVFFKVRPEGQAEWQHARLVADKVLNPTGYGQNVDGTPLEFVVPDGEDGFSGMFLRLASADASGDVNAQQVTAVWDWQNIKGIGKDTKIEVRAFGIEMVYVAEGAYYLGRGNEETAPYVSSGHGGNELNWFYRFGDREIRPSTFKHSREVFVWAAMIAQRKGAPFEVTGPGPIPTGKKKGKLWAIRFPPEDGGLIPAAFPNGYSAFYCMKYPYMTQAQYAGFLNTITAKQAEKHYRIGGHSLAVKRTGEAPNYKYEATETDGRAAWISWGDGAAFAAWSGLRPMTELEYEKSIRGPQTAVPNDTTLSYWGVKEVQLGGIYERPVSVSSATGRAFKGTHGRGTIQPPTDWPTDISAAMMRGDYLGAAHETPTHLLISGRLDPCHASSDRSTNPYAGWRAARSAPKGDSAMKPVSGRLDLQTAHLPRLKQAFEADGDLKEWDKPLLTLDSPAHIYPKQFRFSPSIHCKVPWRGAWDMSVKAYMGWDGEALCVAVKATDNEHVNTQTGDKIWNGDAVQFSLVTAKGAHWNLGLALTDSGVVFHKWTGPRKAQTKSFTYTVVRNKAAKTTIYELRLPLAVLGLEPGKECAYYFMFCDDDKDDELAGMRYRFQWAPTVSYPFRRSIYPRFVLDK